MTSSRTDISPRSSPTSHAVRPVFPQSELREESLRDIVRVLRKRKHLIVFSLLGGLAAGLLVCALMRNQYISTATLLVNREDSAGIDLGSLSGLASAVGGGMDDVKTEIQTHTDVLASDSNVLRVISDLKLQSIPPYRYAPGPLGGDRRMRAEAGRPLEEAPATRERLLRLFAHRLKVQPAADSSRLITVSYRDYDPDRAAAIANALVTNYIRSYLQSRYQATARASDWLSGQLNSLKANVGQSQKRLSDYERQTGLSVLMLGMGSLGESSAGGAAGGASGIHVPAVDKLAALNQELTIAEANRIAKEAIYKLTETESPEVVLGLGSSDLAAVGGGSSVISQGNGLQVLQGLRQQESTLKIAYAEAASKYGARNPRLAEMQSQVAAVEEQIRQELRRINERAQNDYRLARRTEDGIRAQYDQQQDVVSKLNDSTIQLEILASEAASSRALYEGLYTKLQEANVEAGVKATNLDLVDPARAAATPTRPNWAVYPAIALGAGLLFGVAGAFIRENLDDALTNAREVERVSGLPVLSYIPLLRRGADGSSAGAYSSPGDAGAQLAHSNAPMAESFRGLRTAILLSTVSDPLQMLLVSSPLSGDGKTTVSYNLAIAFAQQGSRVLLVDADMRKPRLHVLFGNKSKTPGLSEILTGQHPLEAALRRHPSVAGLFLIPSGMAPPNPSELISSPHFSELLGSLRAQFDLVIFDSPPALLVTDAIVLTTKVDGTIMTVRSGVTTRPALESVSAALARSTGRTLGFVLNAVDTSSVEYYYSYGYYGDKKYYEDTQS
jgi:succinoglycan biosynthesis transport protein ExoP